MVVSKVGKLKWKELRGRVRKGGRSVSEVQMILFTEYVSIFVTNKKGECVKMAIRNEREFQMKGVVDEKDVII